jgi:Protein of unknown function (DUF3800)
MRVRPKSEDIVEVYIDESSQTKHRYLVLGAVAIELPNSQKITAALAKARLPELPHGETKWTKVSKSKLAAYKRMIDAFFDNQEDVHFHSLFVDTTRLNHKKFNQGDSEIGFNKEIYLLANKIGQIYPEHYFHVYPDHRDTKNSPEELRLILNRGAAKRGDKRDWPMRRCQFRDSKTVQLLQLTDVLIGSIAFQLNGHHKAEGASAAKIELAEYIMKWAGITDVLKGTARVAKFTIWPRQLR